MDINAAKGIRWDLSDLYASIDDGQIQIDLKTATDLAQAFELKYKPLFKEFDPNTFPLNTLIADYKIIVTILSKVQTFALLSFAEQTNDSKRGAFRQKMTEAATDINAHLLFWDIEWTRLSSDKASLAMQNPNVKDDLHFLENIRIYAPHTLSEPEEKILSIKRNTGGGAFSRLFDETINQIPFEIELDGIKQVKTESEVLSYLHSSDRNLRKNALTSLAGGLENNSHILTYIYNMILADHRSTMKIRSYDHPMTMRNLSNEIDLSIVQNLIDCSKKFYPLAQRYYRLKRKLLNLDELFDYDRYASVEAEQKIYSFEECKNLCLDGYKSFSPEAGAIVQQFFEKNWIDAEIRAGKQGGGFCCATTPDLHPYILVNYTGNIRDVSTVAHELGHGIHQYLARKAGIIETHAPLTMAETASVFGEMLIFDHILALENDPKKRLSLICGKIDDNFATVFRQISMTDFELRAHMQGLKQGELSEAELNTNWLEANAEFYGDSITLSDGYKHGWKYIPHFVHSPFYCYAYAFAQLFVLTLYQQYKSSPDGFVPKYFQILSLGGSKKPQEIADIMHTDLNDPEFWNQGLKLMEDLVLTAEQLAEAI